MPDYSNVLNYPPPSLGASHKTQGFNPGGGPLSDEAKFIHEVQPSKMHEPVLYAMFRDWFSLDSAHSNNWRTNARKEFDFVACEQWEPADKSELENNGRVAITFNRTLSIIKSVAGIEINGRHETTYLPRTTNPLGAEVNEMLTEASNWMADGCDAEDEQSDAFQDCCICGMGWTELRLDFEEDPEGKYIEERVDPLEMVWDGSAKQKNVTDARRVWRVRKMLLSEARERFPGTPDVDLDAAWARQLGMMSDPAKPVEERLKREENLKFDYDPKTEVHIVQVQWWERETYWKVIDPGNPQAEPLEMTPIEFHRLKARYEILERSILALELKRKVYKQAFLGGAILGGVKPAPCADRFSFQCITGERDRNKGTWFGLVRLMKDPQMWANKWLSQSLHILNSTAKGGILAEQDAFPDQREAENTYAQPDAITWVKKGAIAGQKIMQKPGAGLPTAYINLLQFAITSIRDVVGINLELLGMRDVNQPGILEAQRKQAAMTILATLFDSLRRFRKNVGRVRLFFIQNYLSDGRWIRVNGPEGAKFVRLLRDKTLGDYDVIVDDAPTSPNQKEKSWGIIQMMLPAIRDILTPELVVMILEYSPLPAKLVTSLREMLKNPDPQKQQAQQIESATAQAELQKILSEVQRNQAASQKDLASAANEGREQQSAPGQSEQENPMMVAGQFQKLLADAQKARAAADKDAATAERTRQGINLDTAQLAAIRAQVEREQAQAVNLRAKTILDFANAASAASSSMLNTARKSYLDAEAKNNELRGDYDKNMETALTGGLLDALEGADGDALPMAFDRFRLPSLPSVPILGQMPPREMSGGLLTSPTGVGGLLS